MVNANENINSQAVQKEIILREEIRSLKSLILKTMQWRVTLLSSLETVIFFIRRSVLNHYALVRVDKLIQWVRAFIEFKVDAIHFTYCIKASYPFREKYKRALEDNFLNP